MRPLKYSFIRLWIKSNTIAFFLAYLLYTPIAHGFTGGHGRYLTPLEIFTHSIALIVVGLLVFWFQKKALAGIIDVGPKRMVFSIVLFVIFFWVGYYVPFLPAGPDYDILFGYAVLGCGSWLGVASIRKHWALQIIGFLCFPFASFLGELILYIFFTTTGIEWNMQEGMFYHILFWLVVGITTGLVGGAISGTVINRIFVDSKNH